MQSSAFMSHIKMNYASFAFLPNRVNPKPISAQLYQNQICATKMMNVNIKNFVYENGKLKYKKKKKCHRKKFSPEEDEKLKELVLKMSKNKWDDIAKEMPGRNGRQCRDRYKNYLMPGYFNGEWTIEEDDVLQKKYLEYGPQWSKITQFFQNRSANAVKNRWNYYISKHLNDKLKDVNIISHVESTDSNDSNDSNDDSFEDDKQNEDFFNNDSYDELCDYPFDLDDFNLSE